MHIDFVSNCVPGEEGARISDGRMRVVQLYLQFLDFLISNIILSLIECK